jgi:hypothetical protein
MTFSLQAMHAAGMHFDEVPSFQGDKIIKKHKYSYQSQAHEGPII